MGSISHRDGKWRVKIRKKGLPDIDRVFETKEKAEEFESLVESSATEGIKIPNFPIKMWVERLKTENSKKYKDMQRMYIFWSDHLGNLLEKEVTVPLLEGIFIELAKKGLGAATLKHYRIALSQLFKIALNEWKWANGNPVPLLKPISQQNHYKPPEGKSEKKKERACEWLEELRELVAEKMLEKNLSVPKFAKSIGISKASFQHFMDPSRCPSIPQVLNVCDELEISIIFYMKTYEQKEK